VKEEEMVFRSGRILDATTLRVEGLDRRPTILSGKDDPWNECVVRKKYGY
jgi:hypothetical protein